MRRYVSSLIVWLALCNASFADCKIPKKCQVENPPQGLCLWCCIETVGNYHKIKQTRGIVVRHWEEGGGCTFDKATNELWDMGVAYSYLRPKLDIALVKAHTDAKYPIIVSTRKTSFHGSHAIIITNVTDTHVYFIDPNHPGILFRHALDYFVSDVWTGEAVRIWKK